MNEHKALVNEQATAPARLPIKDNTLGVTAASPMKNNTLGMTAATPMKDNTLGMTAATPMKDNRLGMTATTPMKDNMLGMTATTPMKDNMLGMTATSPMKHNNARTAAAPVQAEVMPAYKKQTKPGYYQPGGLMADYSQPEMQPVGYYPPAMPQQGMVPAAMPQTGMVPTVPQTGMGMPYSGMATPVPQRSIFQPASPQGMVPMNGTQRTSIMTSGIGVRDSVLSSTDFTQGFLQTQIGRHVKVEFVIGTNMLVDREGDLVKVGTDYIIIQETETDDYLLCDIYSIKFIRFYY